MTERERFKAVLHFETPDRVPNVEIGYWDDTTARWRNEGLPADMPISPPTGDPRYSRHSRELTEYFHLDAHDVAYNVTISMCSRPGATVELIAEDEETKTYRWSDGLVRKCLKSNEGIFHELDWPVKTRNDWRNLRDTYIPGWHGITHGPQNQLPAGNRDFPAMLALPGFFWQLRIWMGFEGACSVFYEDPELVRDMLEFEADYLVEKCNLVLSQYDPEYVQFDEDMCYNHGPMISPEMTRKFLLPCYKKIGSCIKSYGIDIVGVDSDGMPDALLPVLHEAGVNLWTPFEIVCRKDHDDLLTLARKHPWLRINGGMDKMALSRGKEAIDAEVSKITPLVERGGYIPTIDHKVPPEVSLDAYKYYLQEKAKRLKV
jgi:hypothetical protein